MLTHLMLRDFIIVNEAALEFGPGLTALTGETGAGKSIIVDALLVIAGGRGGADVVRHGAERAEVTGSFSGLPAAAAAWLEGQAIEHDGEILIRRVIGIDGRSRAYVNGQLVAIQQLREFADLLIEIHGQQEFQHLVKRGAQREMLDEHIADRARERSVAELSAAVRDCRRNHESLRTAAGDRDARLELLRYQLAELDADVTTQAAIDELFAERKRLAAGGRLGAAVRAALTAIYEADGDSALDLLAKAAAGLRSVSNADPALAPTAQLLNEASILTREAADSLRRYLDALDVDPGRQDEIERRAAALEALARKHRCALSDLPAHRDSMREEILQLERAEMSLVEIQQRLEALQRDYRSAAERLTKARQQAAAALGEQITSLMQSLGMAGGRFAVELRPQDGDFGPHGAEEIEFMVSANPGQPLKGLAKVASGGELSRISLAIQVAAANEAAFSCMVFDEVDSGIGGGIAEIVGRKLRELGGRSQVLCVTHLPQVAAQAHTQFRVVKHTGEASRTAVEALGPGERTDEIARMLAGVNITENARRHAMDMLSRAASDAPQTSTAADVPQSRARSDVRRARATVGGKRRTKTAD